MHRATLIVKNFGPLKDINIEVRETVCLIGKQATGKSTIAKLLAIFEDENFRIQKSVKFSHELKKFNLNSFIKPNTEIAYNRGNYKISYTNGKFTKQDPRISLRKEYSDTIENYIETKDESFLEKSKEIFSKMVEIDLNSIVQSDEQWSEFEKRRVKIKKSKEPENLDELTALDIYESTVAEFGIFTKYDSIYIPSERNFLHLIAENTLGLINNEVSIPKHILDIGQEYEKAINNIKSLPLKIIDKNFTYKREGKTSYVYHSSDEKVDLLESASGLQSILPILLLVEYSKTKTSTHNYNFIIEEPELNIYPETQHELIKYLIKNCLDNQHNLIHSKNLILTTHSPYILASLNNLLLAFEKGTKNNNKRTQKIIPKGSWLNPKYFNAYELKNGKSRKIMDDKLGQIKSNMIDNVSDKFSNEFDKLLSL